MYINSSIKLGFLFGMQENKLNFCTCLYLAIKTAAPKVPYVKS